MTLTCKIRSIVLYSTWVTLMYGYLHYINIWDTHKKTVVEWKIGLCWGLLYKSGNVAEFLKQCVSFRNSATVGRLLQVQSCNEQVDQSVDDMTGL